MNERLDGWKTIGTYFGRDERTLRRWAAIRGMPVHRVPGGSGSVFALSDELRDWLAGAGLEAESDAGETARRNAPLLVHGKRVWMLAGAALTAGALVLAAPSALRRANADIDRPRSEQASSYYFAGLHALNGRTPAGLEQAIKSFNATIEIEPRFAPAHVGLADTYNLIREFGIMPDGEAYPKAEAAARVAIGIDPQNAGAHRALAFVMFNFRHDARTAETEFIRALELDPDAARTHHWWATTLLSMGRAGEAMREIDRARALDPEATAIQTDRAVIMAKLGDIGAARAELARLAALDPATPGPVQTGAHLALVAHDGPAFVALATTAARLRGDVGGAAIAKAASRGLATGGWPEMMRSMDAETERLYAKGQTKIYHRALIAAVRGDTTRTSFLLRLMIANHEPEAMAILGDAAYDNALRADPALADMLREAVGFRPKAP